MNERKLTKAELDKSEEIVMGMKSNKKELIKRYGKKAEEVMYATARKRAKEKTESMEKPNRLSELVKQALMNPKKADLNKDGKLSDYEKKRGAAVEKSMNETPQPPPFNTVSKKRAKADMKQFLKGKRADGMGKYDAIILGIDKEGNQTQLKSLKDIDNPKYVEYALADEDYKIPTIKEDLDLGHQDDEPHMLKANLYRIGKYAMELYQMMDKFEGQGEVDLPHWWQSKIIKSESMITSAKHYLDFELKEPEIDAVVDVASEEEIIDESISNKPSQSEVDKFFSVTQNEMHYLASKPVMGQEGDRFRREIEPWDEYDLSNWNALVKKAKVAGKIAEMIKGAHSVMGDKSKKKKRPSKKDIKLAKDTQADYKKEEEEDYEGLAARSGASLEEIDMNDPALIKVRARKIADEKEKAKQAALDKKYGSSFMDKLEAEIVLKQQLGDLKSEREQIMIDMEQEAEPEGGEIADDYGSRLNDIDSRTKLIQKDIDDLRMYESLNEDKYYITRNLGRGQGMALVKDVENGKIIDRPKEFKSYNDAQKEADRLEKGDRNMTSYFVSDKDMKLSSKLNESNEDESLNYYLSNAKNRLKDPHTIEDIEYKKTKRGDKFVKIIYKKKYVPGKMMDTDPHFVSVFYNDEKELQKIGKALDIHDLYESINESNEEVLSILKTKDNKFVIGMAAGKYPRSIETKAFDTQQDACRFFGDNEKVILRDLTENKIDESTANEYEVLGDVYSTCTLDETKKSTTSTIAEKLAKQLKEDMGEWPKELTSRYSDEYRFELEKVTPTYQDKPGRALYKVIDIESGELKATPAFGKPEHLMAYADDLIKPQGGTRSTNLGESLDEAKAPKTEEELEAAIEDAGRKIEKHAESLAKIDSAPGGGNWSSSSAEGKKERKLKDAQGKLRDKIDTYTKKLKKLK